MTSIRLENVRVVLEAVRRGRTVETVAVDDASLRVRSGEVMGVIGPTGCGKTTLLRAIAGLVPLAGGQVFFDGEDQTNVPTRDRGLGMVFQDYALYPHFSVWENLSFFFKLRKRLEEAPEKVKDAAEILGIDFRYLLDRSPRNLSVGQRQQVAIGRCLVRDPKIFLMDEPFANLDAGQRGRARVQVKRLFRRFRVTTVYVTHDQLEAAALCDRVAVMHSGRLLQVDTYRNLLTWPKALTVAEFVTTPGTQFVQGAAMEGHFACPAFSVPLPAHIRVRTEPGAGLTLRVRPEAVSLAAVGPQPASRPTGEGGQVAVAAADNVAEAVVEWIEPLPFERAQRVICTIGDQKLSVVLPQEDPVREGEILRLRVDPEAVEVFDTATGVNLALATP